MTQDATVLGFPALLAATAMIPGLFRIRLDQHQRWLGCILAAQLVLLSGLPYVFTYSFDAAVLARVVAPRP